AALRTASDRRRARRSRRPRARDRALCTDAGAAARAALGPRRRRSPARRRLGPFRARSSRTLGAAGRRQLIVVSSAVGPASRRSRPAEQARAHWRRTAPLAGETPAPRPRRIDPRALLRTRKVATRIV